MEITQTTEVKSFRLQLESLKGGYISDIAGERAIYKDVAEILECLDLETAIDSLNPDTYHLNIDIVPKDKIEEYKDIMALHSQKEPQMTYAQAKAEGIIQPADVFDPNPIKNEVVDKNIKVTADNAYTAGQLKLIDWKLFNTQLPMNNKERSTIAGCSDAVMYNQWKKMLIGKATFHLTTTRIAMTILAKYFEANIDFKTTTKAQLDVLKSEALEHLQLLELLCSKSGKFVHTSEVMKIVSKIRKPLV